ncbi:MAG: thioredoxin family protein, partial [Candidatus Electryoneaceae bacterium]|nr:thioredoxin family protein [Candidatus Electryoneaceae bacterium]
RLESDAEMGRKIGRGFAFFVALVGAFYVLLGLMRLEGINFTAPPTGDVQVEHISGINWIYDDEDTAFQRARMNDQPIIIDFGAEWCVACKELDHKTFSDPQVFTAINDNFIPLKIDGTDVTDEVKAVWERYGVRGLPTVLFLSPDGTEIERFEAFRTVDEVMPVLTSIISNQE